MYKLDEVYSFVKVTLTLALFYEIGKSTGKSGMNKPSSVLMKSKGFCTNQVKGEKSLTGKFPGRRKVGVMKKLNAGTWNILMFRLFCSSSNGQ